MRSVAVCSQRACLESARASANADIASSSTVGPRAARWSRMSTSTSWPEGAAGVLRRHYRYAFVRDTAAPEIRVVGVAKLALDPLGAVTERRRTGKRKRAPEAAWGPL